LSLVVHHKVIHLSTQRFQATIATSGTRTYLVIPFDPNEVWSVKQRHYVTGSIEGCTIRAAIDADAPPYFLSLGPAWLRDNGVLPGATVEVVLSPEGPQSDTLPPDIAAALAAEPDASMFFDSLATFYRNNYIRWIESAKRRETRAARIAEMVRLLNAGTKQR
jgi:hypothetical protein